MKAFLVRAWILLMCLAFWFWVDVFFAKSAHAYCEIQDSPQSFKNKMERDPGLQNYFYQIADAIYRAEGGMHAKVAYGILSVPCHSLEECREICLRTIHNSYQRWRAAGEPGEFIDFLGNRYCPPSVDRQGNARWKRNVKSLLKGRD